MRELGEIASPLDQVGLPQVNKLLAESGLIRSNWS